MTAFRGDVTFVLSRGRNVIRRIWCIRRLGRCVRTVGGIVTGVVSELNIWECIALTAIERGTAKIMV